MADQLDEYEQGEKVRSWLRDNGGSLITGIALGLALIAGWQWWQGKGDRQREEASTQYDALTKAIEAKDPVKAKTFAQVLDEKFAKSPYAVLAHLRQAQFLQSTGKVDEAIAVLKSAPAASEPALAELVRLRHARLLLIAGKADEALKQLGSLDAKTSLYPAAFGELRGDILLAQGKRDDARKAYEQALTTLDTAAPTRRMVELKHIEAGGKTPARPEA
jgi:predicted negative regulator of RcsB-dependent stress response